MKIFDSHAHYNDVQFENDIDEVIEAVSLVGVASILCARIWGRVFEKSDRACF